MKQTPSAAELRQALAVPGRPDLTQEHFAHLLGVSFATYNAWERGRVAPGRDNAAILELLQAAIRLSNPEAVRALLEETHGNRTALLFALQHSRFQQQQS